MSTPTPSVAIVIPLFNDAPTLAACLRSVFAHTDYADFRVIVVDDGSTDRSAEVVKDFPQVRLLRKKRGGAASAVNAGIADAAGCDIVRLHADVAIDTAGWLTRLIETAYTKPKAGIVGTRLVFPDGRIHSEGRSLVTGLGLHPQHVSRKMFQPDGAPGGVTEVDAVPGALAYLRHDVIVKIGGFDEGYGAAWLEDDDFCIGARHAGFKVYVDAAVKGVHFTRALPPNFRAYVGGTDAECNRLMSLTKTASNRVQAEYWEAKWGWNPLYPDLGEIRRLHGDTEICWQIGEPLRYHPASDTPTVDCCIVAWNTLPLLRRCLESLAHTDYPADRLNVYVADNASTDGTVAYLEELAKTYPFALHVVKLTVNTGAALGINFAVAAGKGELVARLDDDIVLPPEWLRMLAGHFARRPFAGCVGPKIVNDDATRSIQCGPYRHFPQIHGHEDEADVGQADYISRTTHVRGCCNLYRRDVFARAGLLDGRYSPTQCDDPDHHIALLHAGYEIIYDGRVSVVHKLNTGLGRSHAALSNLTANQNKLRGKWGIDAYEVLERSIDLSREGRYLPDDGDTSSWLALGPNPAGFPKSATSAKLTALFKPYDDLVAADTRRDIGQWIEQHLVLADLWSRNGALRGAVDILHAASNLQPNRADVLAKLATLYLTLGQPGVATMLARHGRHLTPELPELQPERFARETTRAALTMSERAGAIGENAVQLPRAAVVPSSTNLRVLMVNTYENRLSGGDMHQVKKTVQYLERLGVAVDICCTPRPDPRGYDVVHFWNTWFPAQTLNQLKAVRAWRPDVPVVLSPIFWDMREKSWADTAVPHLFTNATSPAHLADWLAKLADGTLAINGATRTNPREPVFRGFQQYQRQLFQLVDHLLPQSRAELANLKKVHGIEKPSTLVLNAAESAVFDAATSDWFVQNYGLKDFVLVVGLVEPRKNQLMLLHALRDTGIPVVVIGRHYDHSYYHLCRRHAAPGTLFIDHLPHEQLASAFKAAKVHALPSWMECAAFVNIEAALSGCALAVSDRTSEKEYFGENAYYCDPASIASIRNAVVSAFKNHAVDAPKRARLQEQFRTQSTWDAAARATLAGYEAALVRSRQVLAA